MADTQTPLQKAEEQWRRASHADKTNKYDIGKYSYPTYNGLETTSLLDGHCMKFYININESSSYYGNAPLGTRKPIDLESGSGGIIPQELDTPITADTEFWGFANAPQNIYKRIDSVISLYIPSDSISFTSRPNWEDVSLSELGGDILKNIQSLQDATSTRTPSALLGTIGEGAASSILGTAAGMGANAIHSKNKNPNLYDTIKNKVGQGAAADLQNLTTNLAQTDFFVRNAGFAVNPQISVMYKDIGMRTFSFSFVFTPHNEDEAKNVRDIIKLFRLHAHPETTGETGRFHIAPSTFDIEFLYKGKRNTNIPKISTCAITGVTVNYSPYGWSTYTDGMPVQTHLNLHFKEMEVMTKEKINLGF